MNFGDKLKAARKAKGLTQKELAAKIHVKNTSVSNWENGLNMPGPDSIQAVCWALDVDANYFFADFDGWVPRGALPLPSFRRVPIVGAIACGQPILADENIQGQADMPEHVHADFALRCKGDSMIDARIHDGDLVFVRKQPEVENGEIAVVRIDDEVTLKYFTRQGSTVILQPANPSYAPMAFSGPDLQRVHVEGKAVAFTSLL